MLYHLPRLLDQHRGECHHARRTRQLLGTMPRNMHMSPCGVKTGVCMSMVLPIQSVFVGVVGMLHRLMIVLTMPAGLAALASTAQPMRAT